tara:strand:- start:1026 stop:3083 length:2058 start_codon:yes stop_codon:yes gene_type:complete
MNKIAILLPYKENYITGSAGAASLYVNELFLKSKYKQKISIFGNEIKSRPLTKNYIGVKISGKSLSKTKNYLDNFCNFFKTEVPDIIEIHNRPNYFKYLKKKINTNYFVIFHNDPLSMNGSKTIEERLTLIKNCSKIIFISNFIKKQFFKGIMENKYHNKFEIIYHGIEQQKSFPKKINQIIFVGKLNNAKGFDIFCNAIDKVLNEFKDWKACCVGDEERRTIFYKHRRFKEYGFLNHKKTINLFRKSSIAVIPSTWEEPYGRTAMEASNSGCYSIVSDKGGLKETANHIILLKNINSLKIYNEIKKAIVSKNKMLRLQKNTFYNVKNLLSKQITKLDIIRGEYLFKPINYNKNKIINVYYSGIKINHRIYNISIGKKLSIGFIKNNYDVLDISDRDYKNYTILNKLGFENYLLNTIKNYQPGILIFGHSSLITLDLLKKIKTSSPNIKIVEWNEDYLGKDGPNSRENFRNLKSKEGLIDYFFVTTNTQHLYGKLKNAHYFHIPCDKNIEYLKQFKKSNSLDIFFAMSHGVNRGELKKGKIDDREKVLKIIKQQNEIKTNFFGYDGIQPIWNKSFYDELSKCSMALNLSRGKPIKHYSSNRIASYIANGLLTFINKKSNFSDFFTNKELVFYNSEKDLVKKIIFFKKNPKISKEIAKRGYLKYHKKFNAKKITKKILSIINNDKI